MLPLVKPSYLGCKGGKVDVLFFGEAPGRDEAREGKAFVGQAGQLLRRILTTEFNGVRVALDNVCPEVLEEGVGKPDKEILERHRAYRAASLRRHRPKVVVLLGSIAMKAFGEAGGVLKRNAELVEMEKLPFILSTHPSYHLRTGMTKLHLLREAMATVKSVLRGEKKPGVEIIEDPARLRDVLRRLTSLTCGFDIETSALDPKEGVVLSAAIASWDNQLIAVPFHPWGMSKHGSSQKRLELVCKWWSRGHRIVHNLRFELKWMRSFGAADPKVLDDTYLQHWMIDEESPGNLNYLTTTVLERAPYWGKVKPYKKNMAACPLQDLCEYNALDALGTLNLHRKWLDHPDLQGKQRTFYQGVLIPFAKLLIRIADNGIHVDPVILKRIRRKMMNRAAAYERRIREFFPGVDIDSPKQMRDLLFGELNLPVQRFTDKHNPSTDQDTLEALMPEEPRLAPLLKARKLRSRIGREIQPLFALSDGENCIHPDFLFGTVVTGRLACSNPNMQNVSRDAKHKPAFTSRFPRGKIIIADFSQHELRIYASIAGEHKMLDMFSSGADFHQLTADVLGRDRNTSKNCNFGVIYDISPQGLEEKYQIPVEEGRELIKKWKETFPCIPQLHKNIRDEMKRLGYVETLLGRRRHVSNPSNGHELRQGYNCVAQTPAAELCFIAMLRLQKAFDSRKMKALLILQVHDSIVVDSPKNEVSVVTMLLKSSMLAHPHGIPLAVEVKVQESL